MTITFQNLAPNTAVHRIGGGEVGNLGLKPKERTLSPPGISILLNGTPESAAQQMRDAFPNATRLSAAAETVGSTTIGAIQNAGFDVISAPTRHFPNHARLIHKDGVAGFSEENLERLATVFQTSTGT